VDSGGDAVAEADWPLLSEEQILRLGEFADKVEPLGVAVQRAATAAEAGRLVARWAAELEADRVALAGEAAARFPDIAASLAAAGVDLEPSGDPAVVRDAPLGVSLARLAVAETGSLLLAEPTLADRAVGMLSLAQAILCPTAALVADLDAAAMELRRIALEQGTSFATLVTGPSRTADIERVLTVGVQGPGVVRVIFVG
jgi:L-lactate dehydrogenase complex protein LldG